MATSEEILDGKILKVLRNGDLDLAALAGEVGQYAGNVLKRLQLMATLKQVSCSKGDDMILRWSADVVVDDEELPPSARLPDPPTIEQIPVKPQVAAPATEVTPAKHPIPAPAKATRRPRQITVRPAVCIPEIRIMATGDESVLIETISPIAKDGESDGVLISWKDWPALREALNQLDAQRAG
jgi:hypothetical protein